MKNWTIKKRITAGFAAIVLLGAALGLAGYSFVNKLGNAASGIADVNVPGLLNSADMIQSADVIHLTLVRHVLTTNQDTKRELEATISQLAGENAKRIEECAKTATSPEERAALDKVQQTRQDYVKSRAAVLQLSNDGRREEAIADLSTSVQQSYGAFSAAVMAFNDLEGELATKAGADIDRNVKTSKTLLGVIMLVEVAVAVGLGFLVVISLSRVLSRVAVSLGEGSNQVASAAAQVSSASQSLAEGASEQAASLEETSASLEEMSSMTKRNSENAQKANELAKQTRSAADKGAEDMQTMSAAMEAIKVSSDDIAKIIKTIDEIAFQTNILALNAAVEAARAGEAGMGFAVVADEVRNLAQRSAQAAKETASKIEGAITKTAQGVEISCKVEQALNDILAKVRQVDELVAEVSSASTEQTQGIAQIGTAVGEMDKVTQSNAASAEESASAAEELNAQAECMKDSVGELLRLVGGRGSRSAPAAVSRVTQTTRPAANRPVSPGAPAKVFRGTKPEFSAASAGNRGHEIPMDGDFKNF